MGNPIQDLLEQAAEKDTIKAEKAIELVALAFSRGVSMGSQNVIDHFRAVVFNEQVESGSSLSAQRILEKLEEADKLNKLKAKNTSS